MTNNKHTGSDKCMVIVIELILIIMFVCALVLDYHYQPDGTTTGRGEKSMNALFILYGTASVVYALAVQVAEAYKRYKVFLIIMNYTLLTYLFLLSHWFRNKVIFPFLIKIMTDQ